MILIKEIELDDKQIQNLNNLVLKETVKVTNLKDMKSTPDIIGSGKDLISLESENEIKIVRVRNSIDILKPKIYACFLKAGRAPYSYKMKLGNWSSILLLILVLLNLFSISNTAISKDHQSYPIFIFALLIFLFLMHSETKITDRYIKDAFEKLNKKSL